MFSKRRFRRRNKPRAQNFVEGSESQKETPFIPPVQTKLNIGKPGDAYEVEADRTADEVVNRTSSEGQIQRMGTEEEEVQAKPLADGLTPFVQKQEAEEEEQVQMQAEKEEEEQVQAQEEEEEEQVQAQEEEEEVQAKSLGRGAIRPDFEAQLAQQKGQGQKLDPKDRLQLESAFGANFANVRIHTDGTAHDLNNQINSKAFTHGSDIYFKQGNFDPNSKAGRHLLAHELTHTIQQGAVNPGLKGGKSMTPASVQRVPIDYRALTWDDFNGPVDETSKYSAGTATTVKLDIGSGYMSANAEWDGTTVKVTISFDPTKVFLKGIMETDESWKKKWVTDDEAAKQKFGDNVNFNTKRDILLSHEQIHFKITETIARSYQDEARAAIPASPYVETGTAESQEAMNAFVDSVLNKKADEINAAIDAIYAKASAEEDAVQIIYDKGTVHSKKLKKQEKWKTDFDQMLKAARDQAKAEAAAQQQATE
ncbi:eCIS core domain-containing protein [Poritiphilus flavus]|uniref:DUF4157 domain-containing protein n=1 Tax=Poritiphilus flavus TaxID=2697053 RepID=A0A6L9EHQ5_9FLAO|nr:DUF4157 domain-containing protein [Poritiphilus flavus]NAS14297.1 DUF4157 domain-containing protein [Poritiphilus flavus]